MTPPPVSAELVESAEPEIDLELEPADDVIDLTDRRRVLLQAVFGIDVPATITDEVFTSSMVLADDD